MQERYLNRMSTTRTNSILVAALALSSLPFLASCTRARAAAEPEEPAPPGEVWVDSGRLARAGVHVEPVAEKTVRETVRTSGKVAFDEKHVSHVFSPVSGRIIRIDVELGQKVKKGDVLAVVLSPDVGGATSDLAKANADLVAAQHDFERKKGLFAQHAASQADMESAEDNFHKAKAEKERALQKTSLLNTGGSVDAVSSTFALRSPIDGEVVFKSVSQNMEVSGQYAAGTAAELFTIGDIERVWVMADIFEMDLAKVHPGAPLLLRTTAQPGRQFEGVVDWRSPVLDSATRSAKVRGALTNKDHALLPEMYASVRVVVGEKKMPVVPRAAVVHLADHDFVFREKGVAPGGRTRFERVAVEVDETDEPNVMSVRSGVVPNDKLVTDGAILLTAQ